MSYGRIIGYVLYAIGIIGGVEGATMPRGMLAIEASVVAIIVIIIGSYLLDKK